MWVPKPTIVPAKATHWAQWYWEPATTFKFSLSRETQSAKHNFLPSLISNNSMLGLLSTTIREEFGIGLPGSRANFFQVRMDICEVDLFTVFVQSCNGSGLGLGLERAKDCRGEHSDLTLSDGEQFFWRDKPTTFSSNLATCLEFGYFSFYPQEKALLCLSQCSQTTRFCPSLIVLKLSM